MLHCFPAAAADVNLDRNMRQAAVRSAQTRGQIYKAHQRTRFSSSRKMPERWQSEGDSRKLSDGSSDHPRPKRRAIVEPLVLEAAEYHLNYAAHHTSLSSPRIIAAAAAAANRRRSSEGSLANLQSRQKTAA
eukprot:11319-Heterococcus_DN1.PRE.1